MTSWAGICARALDAPSAAIEAAGPAVQAVAAAAAAATDDESCRAGIWNLPAGGDSFPSRSNCITARRTPEVAWRGA